MPQHAATEGELGLAGKPLQGVETEWGREWGGTGEFLGGQSGRETWALAALVCTRILALFLQLFIRT